LPDDLPLHPWLNLVKPVLLSWPIGYREKNKLSNGMSAIGCSWCTDPANWILTSLFPVKCDKCHSIISGEDTLYLCEEKCTYFSVSTTLDTLNDGQEVEIDECPDCDLAECEGCASRQIYRATRLNNQDLVLFCLQPWENKVSDQTGWFCHPNKYRFVRPIKLAVLKFIIIWWLNINFNSVGYENICLWQCPTRSECQIISVHTALSGQTGLLHCFRLLNATVAIQTFRWRIHFICVTRSVNLLSFVNLLVA